MSLFSVHTFRLHRDLAPTHARASALRIRRLALFAVGLLLAGLAGNRVVAALPPDALQARYRELREQLAHNAFQQAIHLESLEATDELAGDLYAVMEQPYETVRQSLQVAEHWCDILILHPNVKSCRAEGRPDAQLLKVSFGKKHAEPLDKAFPVAFTYRVTSSRTNYLRITLQADTGPFGTTNYQIAFEAVPLESGRTFIHLAYSYDYGLTARIAMKGYLTTAGSGKVGFSVIETKAGGEPVFIGGVRGVVERNTMRYYLAIEAYLATQAAPPGEQLDLRLHRWFAATEQYPRQLHELTEAEYREMKRQEVLRQQTGDHPARR